MERKAVSGIMLTLLLVSLFTLPFNIQPVKAEPGTIYIRADGSIEPSTANITSVDNVTYTFNDNIYDRIVVQRNNIVVDGAGYTLQGSGTGIDLTDRSNVKVKNATIRNFNIGIRLYYASKITLIGIHIATNNLGIDLSFSSKNIISGNNVTANNWDGIWLSSSFNNNISRNNIANNGDGIGLSSSFNNIISRNNIANNDYGILGSSFNNTISGNNITANNGDGIYFYSSSNNNTISGNNITANNYYGIYFGSSFNNTISGNNIANNGDGIGLGSSFNNTISRNNITANNYDGIGLGSSFNNTISGNNIANNDYGIWLSSSFNNTISRNNIANNDYGIYFYSSFNNTISGNNIANNDYGIYFSFSSNNIVSGNNITANNYDGIYLYPSSFNNTISGNNITNNYFGIGLSSSFNNTISGNNIANNDYGIYFSFSSNNIVSGNNITANNGFGILLSLSSNNNSINRNNITANNWGGIYFYSSFNNTISGNNIANNYDGIYFYSSSNNNTISGNNIANNYDGIVLYSSLNNSIYHNSFIDNAQQVYIRTPGYPNFWDDGYPSGGNYWSDYRERYPEAEELDGSGIWDTPYVIDGDNQDRYPFISQDGWENYPITIESNVTITGIRITTTEIHFNASGPDGTVGYINATIPMVLNSTAIKVFIDGTELIPPPFPIITSNGTHYFIYFEFTLSTHKITIQYAPPPFHDVALISITPMGLPGFNASIPGCNAAYAKWNPNWAYGFYIEVVVENKGMFTENNVAVSLYNGSSRIGTTTIASFAYGTQRTINFSWTPLQNLTYPSPMRGYPWPYPTRTDIKANVTVVSGDVNLSNNQLVWGTLTIRYPGDAGKAQFIGGQWVYTPADGKVWVEDLQLFGKWGWGADRAGSPTARAKYEALGFWCDFNHDGKVYVEDLQVMGKTWGDSPKEGKY